MTHQLSATALTFNWPLKTMHSAFLYMIGISIFVAWFAAYSFQVFCIGITFCRVFCICGAFAAYSCIWLCFLRLIGSSQAAVCWALQEEIERNRFTHFLSFIPNISWATGPHRCLPKPHESQTHQSVGHLTTHITQFTSFSFTNIKHNWGAFLLFH